MYKQFYGLKEHPFKLTPDPDFLYPSPVHKKALLYLTYGLETKKGFTRLTGEVGSGKTTVIRSMLKNLHKEVKAAYIVNPKLSFLELFRTILSQLSVTTPDSQETKDVMLDKFYKYLTTQAKEGNPVVIIIDEAQNMELTLLEEIRLLSNFETEKEKLLQIIFVGQPELRDIFALPELRQLKQRISTSVHIEPLDRVETGRYINHRMMVAGASSSEIFGKKACDKIYQYSKGIPRLINIACDAALVAGYIKGKETLDGAIAKEAILELTADGIQEGTSEALLSTEQRTNKPPVVTRKPCWKVALILSLLFAAAIAAGVTSTYWWPLIRQGHVHNAPAKKKPQLLMSDSKSDTSLLDRKD